MAHPGVREGSGGPPRGPGGFGRPYRWAGRGCGSHTKVWRCRDDLPQVCKATCRSTRGRVAFPEVWEGLGVSPRGLGGVRRTTRWSRWGREVHLEVQKLPGGPPGGPGVAGSFTRRFQETYPEARDGSGDPPKGPVGVGRPTWWSRRGRKAHP